MWPSSGHKDNNPNLHSATIQLSGSFVNTCLVLTSMLVSEVSKKRVKGLRKKLSSFLRNYVLMVEFLLTTKSL